MPRKALKTSSSSSASTRNATPRSARRFSTAAIETLEDRKLLSASFKIGIGVNDQSTAFMNNNSGKLRDLGVQTVRLYLSTDFYSHPTNGVVKSAINYANKGFDVMLCVTPRNGTVPSYEAVHNWFSWAMTQTGLKNAVDRWEIGNEPDHHEYWNGSLTQYVNTLLKPAYEVLHNNGEEVVSAGPSWNPNDVQTMINAGMLDYTDYVGYHPYASGVKMVHQRLSEIRAVVQGRKPLVSSEWNVRGLENNPSAWAAAVSDVYSDIASTFAINYYYCAEKVNSPAGPGGIMYSNGAPNQPFWNAFATFKNGGTGNWTPGTTTPTPAPAPTPDPTDGNVAAGTGSISGKLWYDSDNDGNWDSNELPIASRTVFLDTNANGVLDRGERSVTSASDGSYKFTGLGAGRYNLTRVFPSGFHLSNTTAKDVVVTVNAGQQVSNANLGTTDKTVNRTPSSPTPTPTPTPAPTPAPAPSSSDVTIIPNGPTLKSLRFVDSHGNGIAGLNYVTEDRTVSLASLSTLDVAVIAVASSNTGSMKLTQNGATRVDDLLGFTFLPETNRNYTTFHLKAGTYVFSGQAFNGKTATGTAGTVKTFKITFA